MRIPGWAGLGFGSVLVQAVKRFVTHDMSTYAAALAYTVLFAIFPFIIFLIALLSFLQVPQFFDWLLAQGRLLLPQAALGQVTDVLGEIQDQEQGGLLSFGIVLAFWAASAGVRATMNALNVAYGVEESRSAWKRYPLSLLYTLGLATLLVLASGLMLVGPRVMTWLAAQIGMDQAVVPIWSILRWPVSVVLLTLAVALIYYLFPNVEQPLRILSPGAILAVVAWVAASLGFAYYIGNFANYGASYGSLGAVIVLLLYFYLSASMLLLGAEVNAVIAEEQAAAGAAKSPQTARVVGER